MWGAWGGGAPGRTQAGGTSPVTTTGDRGAAAAAADDGSVSDACTPCPALDYRISLASTTKRTTVMRLKSALWVAVVAAVVLAAAALDGQPTKGKERRMSAEERAAVLERLGKDTRENPCIPLDPPANNKAFPPLPHSFITELELTHQEEGKQKVTYGAEAFDRVFNQGVLRYELKEGISDSKPYIKQEIIHYYIAADEGLVIITDTTCEDEGAGNCDPKKSCKAKTLSGVHLELNELFGLGTADGNTGYLGVAGILQWATEQKYAYAGQTVCRGMECDKYDVCIVSKAGDTAALITYYWSLPTWTVDSNTVQVPLAIEVETNGRVAPYFTRAVKQRFDFYEFYSNMRPDIDILEPPADVYCKQRNSKYDPPKMPRFFSYNSETVTPFTVPLPNGENQTHNVEFTASFSHYTYYDWTSKIAMTDSVPWYIFGQEYRYELETRRIQDFNQGLTYDVYKHLDYCYMHRIENLTNYGDVVVSENGTVSLLPPWLFVELDGPWQYNGLHDTRGVEADVWVGQKDLLSFLLKENYVVYYASPLVIDEPLRAEQAENKKSTRDYVYVSMDSVPLKLEQYLNIIAGLPHLMTNIYDYQTQPPFTHSIDISGCYRDDRKRHFLMGLPPDSLEQVYGLEDNLLHATQLALAEVAVISPLRINRELLEIGDGKLSVLFTILPLPSVVGDSPEALAESDLDTAANKIVSTVNNQKLMIVVKLEGIFNTTEPPLIFLNAQSIKEVTRYDDDTYTYYTDQRYTSGAMAGLAIGMIITGALLGVVACMAWRRQGSGQGALPRVSMARKSPLSPSNTINISSDMTASDI